MTDEQINALVAEKIMGWKWIEKPEDGIADYIHEPDDDLKQLCPPGKYWHPWNWATPKYTSEIAAAMEIAGEIEMAFLLERPVRKIWRATFGGIYEAEADTHSRAIVMAALKAKWGRCG